MGPNGVACRAKRVFGRAGRRCVRKSRRIPFKPLVTVLIMKKGERGKMEGG